MLMMPFAVRVKLSSDENDLPSGSARGNDRACALLRSESEGLGSDFLASVEEATQRIEQFPKSGPIVRASIRKRLVSGFPFNLLYEIQPDRIYIAAVMHQHRRPGYWLKRVE